MGDITHQLQPTSYCIKQRVLNYSLQHLINLILGK